MTKNAESFIDYVEELTGQRLESEETEDNDTIVWINSNNEDSSASKIMLAFDSDDNMLYIYSKGKKLMFDEEDTIDINEVLRILNKFNSTYTVNKFVYEEKTVCVEAFLPFNNNFSSEIVMNTLQSMVASYDELVRTFADSGII